MPNDYLQRWPVSKRVNSSKVDENDQTLIEKMELAAALRSRNAQRLYITGELAPTRYVPSAAIFARNQDHIGTTGASPDSGFDIQSDLLLAILTSRS